MTLFAEAIDLVPMTPNGRTIFATPIQFQIPQQQTTLLLGPNGSGKTTLMETFCGSMKISSGTLTFEGSPLSTMKPKDLSALFSYVAQSLSFPEHLSILELIRLTRRLSCLVANAPTDLSDTPVDFFLKVFDVQHLKSRTLSRLSSGERQRAFLAAAFCKPSKAVLLDEPTNHLDPLASKALTASIHQAIEKEKRTVIIATHDKQLAHATGNWFLGFREGKIKFCGGFSQEKAESIFDQIFV